MKVKALVFDYGGTLDTGGRHWGKVLWHAYEDCAAPVTEDVFRQAYVYGERYLAANRIITPKHTFRDTLAEKIRLQLEWIGRREGTDLMKAYHGEILDRTYTFAKKNTEKSVKVLSALAARYPMALVSNFYGNINTVLREFNFTGLFSHVIESAVVGIRKPDPRIFALGADSLNTKAEETLVVGDSHDKDIAPAHSIGCPTVWIKGEGWNDEETLHPVADFIISDLQELDGLLPGDRFNNAQGFQDTTL